MQQTQVAMNPLKTSAIQSLLCRYLKTASTGILDNRKIWIESACLTGMRQKPLNADSVESDGKDHILDSLIG